MVPVKSSSEYLFPVDKNKDNKKGHKTKNGEIHTLINNAPATALNTKFVAMKDISNEGIFLNMNVYKVVKRNKAKTAKKKLVESNKAKIIEIKNKRIAIIIAW